MSPKLVLYGAFPLSTIMRFVFVAILHVSSALGLCSPTDLELIEVSC